KAVIGLGSESAERIVRRAAMLGLTSVRGKEAASFTAIAKFVKDDAERPAAIQALLRIPQAEWPKEDANKLVDVLVGSIRKLPVQAGKPVEFVFENTDIMPHNFVILRPGTLEPVGIAGEAQATQPGALERNYVPQSNDVLLASRLLQPRDSQRLSYTAPKEPG